MFKEVFVGLGLIISVTALAQTALTVNELPLLSGVYATGIAEDWLVGRPDAAADVFRSANGKEIVLSNGILSRTFRIEPNAATVALDLLSRRKSLLRGVKPEAELLIDGRLYPVGGLMGQPNYAFLQPDWVDTLHSDPGAFQFTGFAVGKAKAPFPWKRVRHHAPDAAWPPAGVHLRMDYRLPEGAGSDIEVQVHYELYDGIPVIAKWIVVENGGNTSITIGRFSSEILAAVEYGGSVEARKYMAPPPDIHVETDFAFASMYAEDANHHVVHWQPDPDYLTQVNYQRLTPCLLKVGPQIGPAQVVEPGATFTSFRTFVLPQDSDDRERQGLARRRMYRVLAPWSTENPLMMHARFADWERVKTAIDQAAEAGFEMVILTFGSGFDIENDSPEYLEKMKAYADYARRKGVEIGGYSLLASRTISKDQDVVMPEGQAPTFGNSPCIGSQWGQAYFQQLYRFYEETGFTLLEHDGSYPGDVCASTKHPGHRGYEDSRWNQYRVISDFYRWCRSKGIYLNIPDYYYLTGGNKCAMGYRETNWSLPRAQQVIHTRQNIYDGTWTKLVTMGWMFVPLTEYHGGGAAATIEPLQEHLDHYERMMVSNLAAGVQACYRGPRLFDSPETKAMVAESVRWYKAHREVLEGDLIHLRRADGRDIDYWLMVKPGGREKGALVVFNPLSEAVERTLSIPLYYTGLDQETTVKHQGRSMGLYPLDRNYDVDLPVEVPGGGWAVYFFE